ncbi:aminopeptidase P family protein [Terrilactibacillus laevilacticus]|uniref:aminopeptidase P family protein n=1 Tax=Terrilactibacillus laevilacticus TaxID=1380157 RepID=UPI0011470EE7|nr:aminopeptidase P family protein [Terrilactibacillus laevilacticus]
MNSEFFKNNREKLYEGLADPSITVLFAGEAPQKSADETYPFVPNRHFYYLTGLAEPKVIVVATKVKGKVTETLFIEKADPLMAKWVGETIKPEEAKRVSGISAIQTLDTFETFLKRELSSKQYTELYLDLENASWESLARPSHQFAQNILKQFPYINIHDIYHTVSQMRLIKSPEEIENIRQAGKITVDGIKHLMSHAKPGMKEYELEAYFNFVLKSQGVTDFAFPTICASGQNGTVLHYADNHSTVEDGSLVLLDLGAQYQYYSGDISFTFPVNGKFSERQKVIYNIVLKALNESTKIIKPGLSFTEFNQFGRDLLAKECQRIGLINDLEDITKYYFHSLGHSLGLDTHDVGDYRRSDYHFEPGFVVTVEPGLYIEEEGIGIRLEDDVLVTEDGYEILTPGLPRTVEEIEAFMAKSSSQVH